MINPLIQREFLSILQRRRAVAALIGMALAFTLLVLARWPTDAIIDLSGHRAHQLFVAFAYGLLAGVLLLVPAYPAASIVSEKNRGTLALLLNSPLGRLKIYFGKLAGGVLFSLVLLSTSLPAAAACFAMGGIDLVHQLGLLYAVLVLVTVEYIALGLMISSYVQSTDAGVRVTYAAVFALSFLSLGPHYFYQGKTGWLPMAAEFLRGFSPLPVVMDVVGHGQVGGRGLLTQPDSLLPFWTLNVAATLVFAGITVSRLSYRIFDRPRPKGRITQELSAMARLWRRLVFVVDPQRRKAGIPRLVNPVMVKEFRCRRFGRSHWLLRLVAVCAIVSLLLTFAATMGTMDWGVEKIGGLMVMLQVVLVVLITPSLAAGLISGERESGGWELLRMTPLTAGRILRGKLFSVAWTLLLVLAATLPGYLVMIFIRPVMWLQVYLVCTCLLLAAVLTLAVSVAISSCFTRTATATTTSYVVLIAWFLGPLLIWLGREQPFGHQTVETALLINPLGAALAVMGTPGFSGYALLPFSWWVSLTLIAVLLVFTYLRAWRLMTPT